MGARLVQWRARFASDEGSQGEPSGTFIGLARMLAPSRINPSGFLSVGPGAHLVGGSHARDCLDCRPG